MTRLTANPGSGPPHRHCVCSLHGVQNAALFVDRFALGCSPRPSILTGGLEAGIALIINNVGAYSIAAMTSSIAQLRATQAISWTDALTNITIFAAFATAATSSYDYTGYPRGWITRTRHRPNPCQRLPNRQQSATPHLSITTHTADPSTPSANGLLLLAAWPIYERRITASGTPPPLTQRSDRGRRSRSLRYPSGENADTAVSAIAACRGRTPLPSAISCWFGGRPCRGSESQAVGSPMSHSTNSGAGRGPFRSSGVRALCDR